ncbi:MAG: hypothetical protein VW362_08170, partial [Candidatus Nanopelagicales bacterium]
MGRRWLTGRLPRRWSAAGATGLIIISAVLFGTEGARAEDPVFATATNPIRVTLTGLAPVALTEATA